MEKMTGGSLPAKRTTLTVLLVSLLVAACGLGIMAVGSMSSILEYPRSAKLVTDVGSLLLASVAVSLVWELTSKRALTDELFHMMGVSEAIRGGGLIGITTKFYDQIPWSKLFSGAFEVDLFFAYGGTWTNTNRGNIQEFAKKPKSRLRLFLPDPEATQVVEELARRFEKTPDDIKRYIQDCIKEFRDHFEKAEDRLEIWLHKTTPMFTSYRFNDRMVVALYKHRRQRQEVPAFLVEKEGSIFSFVEAELDNFTRSPVAAHQYVEQETP